MNRHIKKAYEKGQIILFLGSGCSESSKDQFGKDLLSSSELSKKLAEKAGLQYSGEPLSRVYSATKKKLGDGLYNFLLERYKHCQPSDEYNKLSHYVWPRIYTINIDDAFDTALRNNSDQKVNIRYRHDKVVDHDQLLKSIDYIKLNGCVDRIKDGLIFSSEEYGKASSESPLWYKELAEDFYNYTFIFIGTTLNEPLFYHQIARYKADTNSIEGRSYVITPSATQIEKDDLSTLNLEHLSGSLNDFVKWLSKAFPKPIRAIDIACNRNPAIREMLSKETKEEQQKYTSIFNDITLVSRKYLKTDKKTQKGSRNIRSFYKGFKPEWTDILDGVPANLSDTQKFFEIVVNNIEENINLIVLYGPAGCGKTTLLKQVAFQLSEKNIQCYFLERPTTDFKQLVIELEKLNDSPFCIFFDRLDAHVLEIKEIIESRLSKNCIIVGSESQRKWKGELEDILGKHTDIHLHVSLINRDDAQKILAKLEMHGPWTRLSKMSKDQRIRELVDRSKRQLLIGLLETTYGEGFEKIIEKEFSEIESGPERHFIILVGLATMHRYYIRHEYVSRALSYLGISLGIRHFIGKLSGIVNYTNEVLIARHPVYVRHLFAEVISDKEIFPALKALLFAYTVYESPVSRNVPKNEMQLFKALINHKFLKDIFRREKRYISDIYEYFEKDFENDGHFLLQYGLALRDFNKQNEAYEKIRTAFIAFPTSSHIEHALAQQELILACIQTSKTKAYDYLDKATSKLENLNKFYRSRSAYPIVTLSEGHTAVMRKFESEEMAIEIAKYYANRISSIEGYMHHSRLRTTWKKLTKFVTNGTWVDDSNGLYECAIPDYSKEF